MNAHFKKIILLLVAGGLLFGAGRFQNSLNRERETLGLTRTAAALENAPPMLAFTTVALGGFRGLISNFLWIRANDLQQDDKFFEATQLADWITDLEPTFGTVWIFQAWNMAFNISVKFKDFSDRWRWVENGISLLRDDGLRYNPDNLEMFRELAGFFQFKIGANMDDANMYYKREWAMEMDPFFGPNGTNFSALVNPPDAAARTNAAVLREKFKIDPVFAEKLNEEYGPLDWRLPEAHAIYWGARGLDEAQKHPDLVKPDDEIKLRRIIYQSMQQAFYHGRLLANPFTHAYSLGPDLNLIPKANDSYLNSFAQETDPGMQVGILRAHRNFLRSAIYFLYENNRIPEAQKWFDYLGKMYPNQPIVENDPHSLPKNLTLDQYAVAVVQIDIGEDSQDRVTSAVAGLLTRAYASLALDENDRYENLKRLADRVYENYRKRNLTANGNPRTPLPPYDDLNRDVLKSLLDPTDGLPFEARQVLRTQLRLPAETVSTNAPPAAGTNADATVSTNSAAK